MCNDNVKFVGYRDSSEVFALIVAFENCTLPREKWTQAARLTVIFWYLLMNPLPTARRLIRDGFRRYDFEHNITTPASCDGHKTLMANLVRAVNDYLKQARGADSFVNHVNGLFRHLADRKAKLKNPQQTVYAANSMSAEAINLSGINIFDLTRSEVKNDRIIRVKWIS